MQVIWQERTNRKRVQALTYGMKEFGEKTARKLNDDFEHTALLLAANPHLGAPEPLLAHRQKEYRSIVVHKLYKLLYYIDRQTLYITDLWDTRREPKSLVQDLQD